MKNMNDEEYLQTQMTVLNVRMLIEDLDLDGFIKRINYADAVGPIIDPTLWMKGNKKMNAIRDIAVALKRVQDVPMEELQNA